MKKADFTPEFVHKKLEAFILKDDYPHDEMLEIGGTHARMTSLSDLDVDEVTQEGSSFIVEGEATVDAVIELGDGDGTIHRSLPMEYKYEFDSDGEVLRRIHRNIDTAPKDDPVINLSE